jgi:Tfp pilus assembly protein PilF
VPAPGSPDYLKAVTAFYVGTSAVAAGDLRHADPALADATKLAPGEPAAWANWGITAIRLQQLDKAATYLAKAHELAPENGKIEVLLALLDSKQGKIDSEIKHLERALQLDPKNLRAQYSLAYETERLGGPDSESRAQQMLSKISEEHPNNIVALLETTRLAAKRGDAETLKTCISRLQEKTSEWSARQLEKFAEVKKVAQENPRQAATQVTFLLNVSKAETAFRRGYAELKLSDSLVGEPLERPLKLVPPPPTPNAPDESLTFTAENETSAGVGWAWAKMEPMSGKDAPVMIAANGRHVKIGNLAPLPFPGGSAGIRVHPSPSSIAVADLNNDLKQDLVFAGNGGLKLYQQGANGSFTDVTAKTKLPAAITGGAWYGAWAVDIEMDGDLDIVLAAVSGPPLVLRNNGDGTFKETQPFQGVSAVRNFAWVDLDDDGAPDAALIDDQGKLHVYSNQRSGVFKERPVPPTLGAVAAMTVLDANRDGVLDLALIKTDGSIVRLSDKAEGTDWEVAEIARWTTPPALMKAGSVRLFTADLDNNGGLDLVLSAEKAGQVWLSDVQGSFKPLVTQIAGQIYSVVDVSSDGRLDFVGVTDAGAPIKLINKGAKNYHWQVIRPRANPSGAGDLRINSFGIGGEIELRAGLLVEKQQITGPLVHFGLGEYPIADVERIVWPNGSFQAEFALKSDEMPITEQRINTSCPWVFTWDGKGMQFVTDFIWRSPLGLKINAQDTAGVMATEDWVKIRGDQLAPKDGSYDVRITAELWETHFFDHVSLMVVDHPAGTEVYTDERFAVPPPALKVYATTPPQPVMRAVDDKGQDVTDIIKSRDGRYLDTFGRGDYQGVARDHYVELDIPEAQAGAGPFYLLANGWIHPTDSSINVALGQGSHAPPHGLSLEAPDTQGHWVVVKPNLGFPEGKTKTILIPLDGVFKPGAPRKVRLRTNLEIFWDSIEVANLLPATPIKTQRLKPTVADLHYRGYSVTHQPNMSSPEVPVYEIGATGQRWRDLIGYHTRFGDVRELLEKVDDRYVIMNGGDEMTFQFAAPPAPPAGWKRDYVLIGDGWVKDGNYNTTFSKTILPLPAHNRPDYNTPPGRLEDDPVYRLHKHDWEVYHTRYTTPDDYRAALRPKVSE